MKKNNIYYTLGHSNRLIEEFIEILKNENINCVVDVRRLPGSNKYPQFNKEELADILKNHNINYVHILELGGLRKNRTKVDFNINGYWLNKSFHNYADYALSDNNFDIGLKKLLELGDEYKCVIICAEALWWRCHRRIITDYLLSLNKKVYHIYDSANKEDAILNEGAIIIEDNKVTYPSNSNI